MVDVPTMTDFAALAARVTALEADAVVPPEPTPPVDGVQAKRIVDLIEPGPSGKHRFVLPFGGTP